MIVADLPFKTFLNLLRSSAKTLNFRMLAILVAREADCSWAFKQLEEEWASLHDITNNKIIIVTVDGRKHIPVADNGIDLRQDMGTLKGNYGLVTFSSYCKLYNNVIVYKLPSQEVSKWTIPIQEFAKNTQPLEGWRDGQSLGISSILSILDITETQVPCFHIEIVNTQYKFIIPIQETFAEDFSFYKKFKKTLVETNNFFKIIQSNSAQIQEINKLRSEENLFFEKNLLWLKQWQESQSNLPEYTNSFISDALEGKADPSEVYRVISFTQDIKPETFIELRNSLTLITSNPNLISKIEKMHLLQNDEHSLKTGLITQNQKIEHTMQEIFKEDVGINFSVRNPEVKSNNIQIFTSEVYMESKYKITGGQQGSVGDQSSANDFNQIVNQRSQDTNLTLLTEQLSLLIIKLESEIQDQKGDEAKKYNTAIKSLSSAKAAAEEGDENKAHKYISIAGAWLVDFASKVGVSLIVEILKKNIGS